MPSTQVEMPLPLPCFVCGTKLESALGAKGDKFGNLPDGATVFSSHGNYGSTVYDPIFLEEHLEINLCDRCLQEHPELVARVEPISQPKEYRYQKWRPNDDQR
jgi:hypothetical protein